MSCNCSGSRGNFNGDDCVKDVIRKIIRAQRRAVEAEEDTCFTSCDRSIEELLSPFEENRERLRHNTIPFILFCKGNCKPFVGAGVRREHSRRSEREEFECFESPIFRAKSFVNGNEDCVRLELLVPVRHRRNHEHEEEHSHEHCKGQSVCDFIPERTRNFRATGICITVNLDCFCGISCLDPITPLRARDED